MVLWTTFNVISYSLFPDLRLGLLSDKEQKESNKEITRSIFSHYGLTGGDDASKEVRGALCKDYIVGEKYGELFNSN